MPRRAEEWTRDSHPPYCTCASCVQERMSKWETEKREEGLQALLRQAQPRPPSRRGSRRSSPIRHGTPTRLRRRRRIRFPVRLLILACLMAFGVAIWMEASPIYDSDVARDVREKGQEAVTWFQDTWVASAGSSAVEPGENLEESNAQPVTESRPSGSANRLPRSQTLEAVTPTKTTPSATSTAGKWTIQHGRPAIYPGGEPLDKPTIEKLVIQYTNQARTAAELPPLIHDSAISDIARAHSEKMVQFGYSHDIQGKDPTDRARVAGYNCRTYHADGSYSYGLSENIYKKPRVRSWLGFSPHKFHSSESMARALVTGWMNSPGHKANILDEDARRIGIGVAIEEVVEVSTIEETVFATQNFSKCE